MIGTFENACHFYMPLLDLCVNIRSFEYWHLQHFISGLKIHYILFSIFGQNKNLRHTSMNFN